jgi:hypothetical protein
MAMPRSRLSGIALRSMWSAPVSKKGTASIEPEVLKDQWR